MYKKKKQITCKADFINPSEWNTVRDLKKKTLKKCNIGRT